MFTFRAHHLLCHFCFAGKGYSPKFVDNFSQIQRTILETPEEKLITIKNEIDDICGPCPNHKKNTSYTSFCTEQAKIDRLDSAHAKVLELKENDILSWNEAKSRIQKKITPEVFEVICENCEWKPLGICRNRLFEKKNPGEKPF